MYLKFVKNLKPLQKILSKNYIFNVTLYVFNSEKGENALIVLIFTSWHHHPYKHTKIKQFFRDTTLSFMFLFRIMLKLHKNKLYFEWYRYNNRKRLVAKKSYILNSNCIPCVKWILFIAHFNFDMLKVFTGTKCNEARRTLKVKYSYQHFESKI